MKELDEYEELKRLLALKMMFGMDSYSRQSLMYGLPGRQGATYNPKLPVMMDSSGLRSFLPAYDSAKKGALEKSVAGSDPKSGSRGGDLYINPTFIMQYVIRPKVPSGKYQVAGTGGASYQKGELPGKSGNMPYEFAAMRYARNNGKYDGSATGINAVSGTKGNSLGLPGSVSPGYGMPGIAYARASSGAASGGAGK